MRQAFQHLPQVGRFYRLTVEMEYAEYRAHRSLREMVSPGVIAIDSLGSSGKSLKIRDTGQISDDYSPVTFNPGMGLEFALVVLRNADLQVREAAPSLKEYQSCKSLSKTGRRGQVFTGQLYRPGNPVDRLFISFTVPGRSRSRFNYHPAKNSKRQCP